MKKILIIFIALPFILEGQIRTFKSTRVINTHSVETLQKRKLDIRIGHRFGDLLGNAGGWSTFYGLESARDITIGAEYGLTDLITIGLCRTKGGGPLRQNLNGNIKYRFLSQDKEGKMPLSMAFVGVSSVSTMSASDNPEALNNFTKTAHRFSYAAQLLLARKFGDVIALQIIPSYTHRNLVAHNDENGIFSIGAAAKWQMTKVFGILVDATLPFSDLRTSENGYYAPLGIGLEIDTGGHIFQVNFTNATGIMETDYIPYTRSNWADGEFRLGFTISRLFNL